MSFILILSFIRKFAVSFLMKKIIQRSNSWEVRKSLWTYLKMLL